jgi:hypothetical protein
MARRALENGAASLTALGLLAALGVALPAACFYPDYSFNEPAGDGGSGATTTTGGNGPASGGGPTTSSTGPASGGGGNGGAPVGGGGASSSSSVGGNLGEICNNGMDDDRDMQVDCEDGECVDHACVSAIPAGWTGYYAVYEGPLAVNDPGCPTDYPGGGDMMEFEVVANKDLIAPAATCSACTCATPSGQTCTLSPNELTIDDATCVNNNTCVGTLPLGPANGTCLAGTFFDDDTFCGPGGNCTAGGGGTSACNVSASVPAATVSGGTCASSGGTPSVQAAGWQNLARACGDPITTGVGCNVNQVCLPKPAAPFEGGICIRQDGEAPVCPPGGFANKHVFHTGFTDTRGCAGCSCSGAAGGSCEITVQVHSNAECTSQIANLVAGASGACANLTQSNPEVHGRKATVTKPPTGSTCTPAGGQPTGTATPTGAVTFCCTN